MIGTIGAILCSVCTGEPATSQSVETKSNGLTDSEAKMLNGWISLRVKDPRAIGAWYTKVTGMQVVGSRPDMGGIALGDRERGYAIILLPGESIEHPERLQMHFEVADVDAEYDRLRRQGVEFDEPPADQPWGWRHAYTHDPVGHTVELCTPLTNAQLRR